MNRICIVHCLRCRWASFRTIFTVVIVGMIFSSGCDNFNRIFTGRETSHLALNPAGPKTNSNHNDSEALKPIFQSSSYVQDANSEQHGSGIFVKEESSKTRVRGGGDLTSNELPRNDQSASGSIQVPPGENNEIFDSSNAASDNFSTLENSSIRSDGKIVIQSATLKFVNDLEIAAQADGLITEFQADEGDILTSGSTLILLDDRLAQSELAVAQKELESAMEKAKDTSEIDYNKSAYQVAQIDYEKTNELHQKGSETDAELRKKWLERRRAELAITVSQVKNNQDVSAVGVSQAKRAATEVQIDLRKMIAPFDGVVALKKKERFDWVRAGEVLLRLVSMEQLRVVGQVRVEDLRTPPHRLVGAPVAIDIEIFPGTRERVQGKVGFVSPVQELSGGYRIWVQIPNQKSDDQWLFREGMKASMEITGS